MLAGTEREIEMDRETIKKEFGDIVNKHGFDNLSGTPDHILAEFLLNNLEIFCHAIKRREPVERAQATEIVGLKSESIETK